MILTPTQTYRFWSEWNAIKKHRGWTSCEAETLRKELLARAGFTSLTLVDRVDGFSRVLKELAALRDDLSGMLHADANEQRVLIHNIRNLASQITGKPVHFADAYWRAIAKPRFGLNYPPNSAVRIPHSELEYLSLEQLEQLRNTLENRLTSKRRKEKASAASTDTVPF